MDKNLVKLIGSAGTIIALVVIAGYAGYYLGRGQLRSEGKKPGTAAAILDSKLVKSANFFISGTIAKIEDEKLTVQAEGESLELTVSAETTLKKMELGSTKMPSAPKTIKIQDLQTGEEVNAVIFLTPEGTIQASSLTVWPAAPVSSPVASPAPEE